MDALHCSSSSSQAAAASSSRDNPSEEVQFMLSSLLPLWSCTNRSGPICAAESAILCLRLSGTTWVLVFSSPHILMSPRY